MSSVPRAFSGEYYWSITCLWVLHHRWYCFGLIRRQVIEEGGLEQLPQVIVIFQLGGEPLGKNGFSRLNRDRTQRHLIDLAYAVVVHQIALAFVSQHDIAVGDV